MHPDIFVPQFSLVVLQSGQGILTSNSHEVLFHVSQLGQHRLPEVSVILHVICAKNWYKQQQNSYCVAQLHVRLLKVPLKTENKFISFSCPDRAQVVIQNHEISSGKDECQITWEAASAPFPWDYSGQSRLGHLRLSYSYLHCAHMKLKRKRKLGINRVQKHSKKCPQFR